MKIENTPHRDYLLPDLKIRDTAFIFTTVLNEEVPLRESEGWIIDKKQGKIKTRIRKHKPLSNLTEDRIWTILYKMGFEYISGINGSKLFSFEGSDVYNQIDALAYNNEVAIVIECKSSENNKKKDDLKKDIESLVLHRNSVNSILRKSTGSKIRTAGVLVLHGIDPSDADIERAREENITILDATGLEYYEKLIEHTGISSKYQLLSEIFSNNEIDGLKITLPAVQARFGKSPAYTFAITPEDLLKIAFVAHRNRGRLGNANDQAYQRMIKKTRLTAIKKFIQNGGIFPTNIVINFSPARKTTKSGLVFNPTTQLDNAVDNIKLGWLTLPSRYQSAWIIDGQHRLLAYSGLEEAKKSILAVTAYDCLDISEQLDLFTKINSEQKKVSGNLLTMLHADLKWSSPDKEEQVMSVVSKIALTLNERTSSPFYKRILLADEVASNTRCINIQSFTNALRKNGLFLDKKINNEWVKFGPLWAGTQDETLKRSLHIIDEWFSQIKNNSIEIWNKGKEEGGYISMNNGIIVCIEILRSVFEQFESEGFDCISSKPESILEKTKPYAELIGTFFSTKSSPEIMKLRKLVGTTGQTEVRKIIQAHIHNHIPTYNPTGLQEFIASRADDKIEEISKLLPIIEDNLRNIIVSHFEEHFGDDIDIWWPELPQPVRIQITKLREQDNRSKGVETNYINLKLMKSIIIENWQNIFKNTINFAKSGDKNIKTDFIINLIKIQDKISGKSNESLNINDYELVISVHTWIESLLHNTEDDL